MLYSKVYLGSPPYSTYVLNGDFEDLDGADDFATWEELVAGQTVEDETTIVHGGSHAVKLATDGGAGTPQVRQSVTVVPGDKMLFEFWSRGDGTDGPNWWLYDETNAVSIEGAVAETGTTYARTRYRFEVPAGCVSIRVSFYTFSNPGAVTTYVDDARLYNYTDISWLENDDVLAVPSPTWGYGLGGKDPLRGVADTGTADFTLENDEGKYSPENTARVAGFEEGMPVKIVIDGEKVDPVWIAEIDEQADFDAQVDADGDMNDTVAAKHDGTTGLEFTFDDANVAYGTMNAVAVNQTSGTISLWLNKNDVAIEDGKIIYLLLFKPGAGGSSWSLLLRNNGGVYQIRMMRRTDAATDTGAGAWQTLPAGWNKIKIAFRRSTGAGNDDGWMRLYLADELLVNSTGHDNDTRDWDTVDAGMTFTSSTTFGGSYYIDTIKLSQTVGHTKFIGTLTFIPPTSGEFDNPVTAVVAHDWMGYLNKQELGLQALQSDKRADEALTTILTEFPNQPEDTDFDIGIETFEVVFAADPSDSSMARMFAKLARNERGRIFSKGDGTLIFEKQGTRDGSQASAFTIDGTMSEIDVVYSSNNIYNTVALDIKTQIIDAAATHELFKLGQGIKFAANQKMTLECNFTDEDTGQGCSGVDVVTPVAAPHFGTTRTPANDDSHADLTDDNYQVGANSLTVDLENTAGAVRYLNEFTILGKRLTDYDRITITKQDAESIIQVGNSKYTNRLDLIEDPTVAEDIADGILGDYAPSHTASTVIEILANIDDDLAQALIEAEPSTKFTAIESITGISKDFYIDNIRYKQDHTLLWVIIEAEEA